MRFATYSRAASNAAYEAAQASWDGMSPEECDPCPRDPAQWAEWCAKLAQPLDVICDWPDYGIQLESVTLDQMAADLLGMAYEELSHDAPGAIAAYCPRNSPLWAAIQRVYALEYVGVPADAVEGYIATH